MESQTPKLYSTTLLDSLKDVTDKCYIFRAYKSPDGSVKNATGFLPGPLLQSHGHMKAIQEVLQMACEFSVEQSQGYTLHSPRHFLPEVSAARGEPGTCRCEIGRWSQSVAQLPALRPETNMLRKHRARASTLPDLYAKNNATQRPLAILGRQLKALRDSGFSQVLSRKITHARGSPEFNKIQDNGWTTRRLRTQDVLSVDQLT